MPTLTCPEQSKLLIGWRVGVKNFYSAGMCFSRGDFRSSKLYASDPRPPAGPQFTLTKYTRQSYRSNSVIGQSPVSGAQVGTEKGEKGHNNEETRAPPRDNTTGYQSLTWKHFTGLRVNTIKMFFKTFLLTKWWGFQGTRFLT